MARATRATATADDPPTAVAPSDAQPGAKKGGRGKKRPVDAAVTETVAQKKVNGLASSMIKLAAHHNMEATSRNRAT